MTAWVRGRRGAGFRVLGWLLFLAPAPAGAGTLAAQPDPLIFSREVLLRTGRPSLAEALQALLPSFNLPHPSNAGGSDFVRPATLFGLGADQFLVLVNGMRRHPSALLDLHPTIGRGQGTTDLDAIPLAAIERVEVYRTGGGGGAARFGFGAVTAVLNLVLRNAGPNEASAELGQTTAGDGTLLSASGSYRAALGHRGFVRLSAELSRRGATNHALPDRRLQYFPGDARNNDPALNNRIDQRFGDPERNRLTGWVQLERPLSARVLAYGFAGLSRESGEAGELWRTASDDRTLRALYPNGFLPLLTPRNHDGSAVGGIRGQLSGWSWDASLGYGLNSFRLGLKHSANVSLGPESPTEFDAGTLRADLLTVSVSATRSIGPLRLSLGGEHRSEGYQIRPGEPDSYRYGAVPIQDGPHAGALAPIGAQGFPGFQPADATTRRRGVVAAYGQLSGVWFQRLTLTASGRVERYPGVPVRGVYDFRAELGRVHGVSLWGGYGTAVRMPSLSESWFSYRQILVNGNFGFEDRTVPPRDPLGVVLGARPLRAERSRHWTAGITVQPLPALTLSARPFRIAVDDRIILSGTFDDPGLQLLLAQQGFNGIKSVRFFANALATRTAGMEAAAAYRTGGKQGRMELNLAWSHQVTRVRLTDSVPGLLAAFTRLLFDRVERNRLTHGQPRDNVILSLHGERGRWMLDSRIERYGSVTSFGAALDGSLDQKFGAKYLGDVSVSYRWRRLELRLGADNVFNRYPDRNRVGDATSEGNSYFGMFPYNIISPFGFNGRFLHLNCRFVIPSPA